MFTSFKRKNSSTLDGNPPKKRRYSPKPFDFDEAFAVIENEHENIELLLYRRRRLTELNENDSLYADAEGDFELQLAETGRSVNIDLLSTDTDLQTLEKLDSCLERLLDRLVDIIHMPDLCDDDVIYRVEAIHRNYYRLKREIAQLMNDIYVRENAERNYLIWFGGG